MKTKLLFLIIFGISFNSHVSAQTTTNIFNDVLFYDGYAALVSHPVPPGVLRLRNDLISTKLTATQLNAVGNTLKLNIQVRASCDNYDRIANVNLALVPKNQTTYTTASVQRIELARFITPFMNFNIQPDTVPYTFQIDNIAKILKDQNLNLLYDFWIELQIFGVPYAANTQVAGCAGRNDVFYGTLDFETNGALAPTNEVLIPLNFQKNLNNYQVAATDAVGTTVRTISFNVENSINNAEFNLITSNHGSNSGGEEYNRRVHFVDFNNVQIHSYTPGELTCEPYRVYNTQGNGIFGPTPRTPAQWQSFSNWCPGSKIPIRKLLLGTVAAGNNTFRIRVPTAVFAAGQGYIPVSLYLQGTNTVLSNDTFTKIDYTIYPNPTSDYININSDNVLEFLFITDISGKEIVRDNSKRIDISGLESGIYFLTLKFENFHIMTEKIIKK